MNKKIQITVSSTNAETAHQSNKPHKIRYCKRCGAIINSIEQKCSGCGKRTGFHIFNKIILNITLVIFTIATICLLVFYNYIDELEDQVSTDCYDLKQEIDEYYDFFYYTFAVCDSQTNTMTFFEDSILDLPYNAWLINYEYAEQLGLTKDDDAKMVRFKESWRNAQKETYLEERGK